MRTWKSEHGFLEYDAFGNFSVLIYPDGGRVSYIYDTNRSGEGIDNIRDYLVKQVFINDYENLEMLKSFETALKNGEMITGADALYYLHELKEA